MLIGLVALAMAADPVALRRAMEAVEGWKLVETKSMPEVGPVVVRHKAVLRVDCLEGSITAPLDADALVTAAVGG
ncbi:MAG: hypothetical protein FJ095_20675 [Deltaproteobacteria bacterium]|nr:hypothetical protein [Deltaproteobacteria bacterium]